MRGLIIVYFFSISLVFGEDGAEKILFGKKYSTLGEFDTNKDQKIDLIVEKRQEKFFYRLDTNFDGNFDTEFEFSKSEIVKKFSFSDKSPQKITRYDYSTGEKIKITWENNQKGIYNILKSKTLPRNQFEDSPPLYCRELQSLPHTILDQEPFLSLIQGNLSLRRSNGGVMTDYGLLLNQNCLDHLGDQIYQEIFPHSFTRGIACLQNLNTPMSELLAGRLINLLNSSEPLKMDCTFENFSREDGASNSIAGIGRINEPHFAINPDLYTRNRIENDSNYMNKLQSTIFHEMLHNAGFPHNLPEEIDRPYICSTCCFNNYQLSEDIVAEACLACSTLGNSVFFNSQARETEQDFIKRFRFRNMVNAIHRSNGSDDIPMFRDIYSGEFQESLNDPEFLALYVQELSVIPAQDVAKHNVILNRLPAEVRESENIQRTVRDIRLVYDHGSQADLNSGLLEAHTFAYQAAFALSDLRTTVENNPENEEEIINLVTSYIENLEAYQNQFSSMVLNETGTYSKSEIIGSYLDSFDIARGGNANEFNEVLSFVRAQIPSGASGNLKGRAIALRNPINIWENTVETRYRNALAEEN